MRWAGIALALSTLVGAVTAAAQTHPTAPIGEFRAYELDTGPHVNRSSEYEVVFSDEVHVADAAWLRLYFRHVDLPAGSFVRITSMLDGELQELDAAELAMWSNTSAYFNGDRVLVELVAGPDTRENRISLDRIAFEVLGAAGRNDLFCGICGNDNRQPSSEEWTGRLLPVGCTGSIYNEQSCLVSAGHCVDGGVATVIEFNVPASSWNCNINHPPVADQFPITNYLFDNGGVGDDWAVMLSGTNNLGQTIYDRYGVYKPIAGIPASPGDSGTVWGYGVDDQCTRTQTQQTHSGLIDQRYAAHYEFYIDITGGNSGSALIVNDQIVGIVTHCSQYCPNYATRIDLTAFALARYQLCSGLGYCNASSTSTSYEHISNVTVGSIDNSSGSDGYADYTNLSTQLTRGLSEQITVTIGNPYSSDIGGLWIDWSQDDDFNDSGETITASWSGSGPYAATINVPTWADLGDTRLRVRIQDDNYDPTLDPCGTTDYGEVEDYTVTIVDCIAPDYPTNVGASPLTYCDYVRLTWDAMPNADAYNVYRNDVFDPAGAGQVGTTTATQYDDTTATPGQPYYYWISSTNACGESGLSQWAVGVRAGVPDAPSGVAASDGAYPDKVRVSWSGISGVTQYEVWRNTSDNSSSASLLGTDSSSPYDDVTVSPGQTYFYWVKAENACGLSGWSASDSGYAQGSSFQPGDLNCDGSINAGDIDPFVLALTDPATYASAYPNCDATLADITGDGQVNAGDIDPFVQLIVGP